MICFVNFSFFLTYLLFFFFLETLPRISASVRRGRNIDQRTGHAVRPGGLQRRVCDEVSETDGFKISVRK